MGAPQTAPLLPKSAHVTHQTITTGEELDALCARLSGASAIVFDTEFVSEDTYHPQLCLVQVASADQLAVIDAVALQDLNPFWTMLADGDHQTIVHAGREELNFSLRAIQRRPANLFDTQIAAALVSSEYPAGYGSLVGKFLGHKPNKGETRTDWRRRPLTQAQIRYALEDVRYLLPLHDKFTKMLVAEGRLDWLAVEMTAWQDEVEAARSRERWRKVSGSASMSSRSLAIVRQLWLWRDEEARRRDQPPRRVLRDDLIIEMAKRRDAKESHVESIRGLQRGALRRSIADLAACIQRGLDLSEDECPKRLHRDMPPQLNLLGQFLSPALSSICRGAQVATSIVGTASDVRDLIAYRMGFGNSDSSEPPALAVGWRAELVGNLIDELLDGKRSIRIHDPKSSHPLKFESVDDS